MTTATARPAVGALLRAWRQRGRLTQLELAHRAGVSTRHLSYVETGRSRPAAEMIDRLAASLEVPLRARDELLLAGGYAPRHAVRGLADPALDVVLAGLRSLLKAHLPNPALLLDEYWDVVESNEAVDVLLAGCAPELLEPPVNVVRLSLHPRGLAPRIRNLAEWSDHLVAQVRARAAMTHDPRLIALAEEAARYRGGYAVPRRHPRGSPPGGPVLVLELDHGDDVLRFVSVAARLETAADATLEGLHLETLLPADAVTQRAMRMVPTGAQAAPDQLRRNRSAVSPAR